MGTLIGQEKKLRKYLDAISELTEICDLEDSINIINFCTGAAFGHVLDISLSEIDSWRTEITVKVDEMLTSATTPSSKSLLLELRGYLSLISDSQHLPRINSDEAIKWWMELTVIAKDAPLFPLERFADRLTQFTALIGNHPKFEYLTQQTDLLLEQRYGNIKAAEKCRDRAIAFYENGSKLKAINQLHQAKIKWFSEETLEASSLSILLIAECYRELGLTFAGKYYALAATHICLNPNKPEMRNLISKSLIRAAECDYTQGSWCEFLELADLWLRVYSYYSSKANNTNEEILRFVYDTATVKAITKKLDPQLSVFVQEFAQKWNSDGWLTEAFQQADEAWIKEPIQNIWKKLEEQLVDRPFNDLGTHREASWFELGITWHARWINDSITTPIAEQLVAILQILLADMAELDLCLLKGQISLEISVEEITKPKVDLESSTNSEQTWKIFLPKGSFPQKDEVTTVQNTH